MIKQDGGRQSPSRWKRDGVDLQALEDKLRIEIDPAFFEPEQDFRPFNQVIEILSVSLDQDRDGDGSPELEHLTGNPLHRNIQRQLSVCSDVVERITVEHHSSLNSSVQAMGGVARHYNQTRANVGTLREQLRECKQLLQTGVSQTDVRELWQRKQQYTLVLRLLNALDMIKDAPVKFERLVRQKRFVGAVGLLNESLLNIFSPELVDVPAVSSVRDEMLVQKGRILDTLVQEIVDVLFLRVATARTKSLGGARGGAKSWRRRERGRAGGALAEDSIQMLNRAGGVTGGLTTDATSESSAGEGDPADCTWAGLEVDVTDVGDDEEHTLDDPSQDFSTYLRLLVEAVRRLRCLDDVERYLLERLSSEVTMLSAMHMRTCVGRHEDDGTKSRLIPGNGTNNREEFAVRVQRLASYLSLVFDSFTYVLANHVHLVRLLHAARLRNLRESDPGAPVFEADAPYKESLVLGLWQHIQGHLKDVLARHVTDSPKDGETAAHANKSDASALQSSRLRSGVPGVELSSVPPSEPYFRPLRRPESSATGLVSTPFDHASAAEYCGSCMLADPSPLIVISIFRPTLKFVDVQQTMISAVRKEVFESGHVRDRRGRRDVQEGANVEGSSLSAFMHATACEKLMPLLSTNCKATHQQLLGDHDSFFPVVMASSAPAVAKRSSAETSRGNAHTGGIGGRERDSSSAGSIRPSRGAEDVYVQARTLFRAMVQMPQYAEEIGEVLRTSLEDYFTLVQIKFQDITDGSASRSRLERFSDKLRDLLQRDAHHLMYKAHVYGRRPRWDEGEVTDVLSAKASAQRNPKGGAHPESSAEEEADDIFESEFMILKDLWNFDTVPFPVSKQILLSLRKQQAVACLTFSCDWLAHKLLKMCVVIKHQPIANGSADDQSPTLSGRPKSPTRTRDFEGRISNSGDGTVAPAQKLRQMARKLSELADDSLICLRLEVYMLVSYYMQQLPSINLEVASGQGSTTAMSLGSVEDQCIVNLNRCIREEQEALSPFEPNGGMGLICPRALLAFVLVPLARLLPRLFVRSLRFLKARAITIGGVGKLNKILNTLEQTVGDVTEEDRVGQDEGTAAADGTRAGIEVLTGSVGERFGWARQYVALISMAQGELEAFIRNNRTKFSKDEYRVQWSLVGPNRRPSDGGTGQKFEMWWASEKF